MHFTRDLIMPAAYEMAWADLTEEQRAVYLQKARKMYSAGIRPVKDPKPKSVRATRSKP